MVLSFIGFSGCGKSYVTKRFVEELGWKSYACDALIEGYLGAEVPPSEEHGTRRVGLWLGQPYSPGFDVRQEKYNDAEKAVMTEICAALEKASPEDNLIVDTTGSVIHTGSKILAGLRAHSYVIYFQLPISDEELLFKQYLEDPKPVIWQRLYHQAPGETPERALRRCYRSLLRERSQLYERYADLTVPAGFSERGELTPTKLLSLIEQQ